MATRAVSSAASNRIAKGQVRKGFRSPAEVTMRSKAEGESYPRDYSHVATPRIGRTTPTAPKG